MQLPLWLYLLVSAAAIGFIALMVRRLKPGAPPAMTPERALQAFRDEFPAVACRSAVMSTDGRTILFLSESNGIVGVTTLAGLRWTSRQIGPHDIAAARAEGSRLIVSLTDFTWHSLAADWPDAGAAHAWATRFISLKAKRHA